MYLSGPPSKTMATPRMMKIKATRPRPIPFLLTLPPFSLDISAGGKKSAIKPLMATKITSQATRARAAEPKIKAEARPFITLLAKRLNARSASKAIKRMANAAKIAWRI